MIFYWVIVALRWMVWLFKPPTPEQLARADRNERCPVCGWRMGRMRCVKLQKPSPRARDTLPEEIILRQHRCKECGAGWHHEPIVKGTTPGNILPSVARTRLEQREDRHQAYLDVEETTPTI